MTRQATHIKATRAKRRSAGLCVDCGNASSCYRCLGCSPARVQSYQTIPIASLPTVPRSLRIEEKLDGCWHSWNVGNAIVIGEKMRDGRLFAFDCVESGGDDQRKMALSDRLRALDAIVPKPLRPPCPSPGESASCFFARIVANGGEGIVIKDYDAHFNATIQRCKRFETFDLMVVAKDINRGTLSVADSSGHNCGSVPCKKMLFHVNVGDIVEVECFGLTKKKQLREPRFKRVRYDKMTSGL